MKNYITLENEFYQISLPSFLKDYGNEVLEYSTNKIKEYLIFFKEKSYGCKIRGSFMITYDDFLQRIKNIKEPNDPLPPRWATGCFYGEEIQILLDENNPYNNFLTLAHETFHLLFNKFIYEKNHWNRIVWLDEALAGNFDDTTEKIVRNGKFKDLIYKYYKTPNLPKMQELNFSKENIKTEKYNAYELFKIVGRFLIETKTKEELLSYINNLSQIKKDESTILKVSLEYFCKKYNQC